MSGLDSPALGENGLVGNDLTPADVLGGKPSVGVLVKRGLRKRCPRCGGGGLYRTWFRMAERCPTCGFRFEREPGFFIGAYFVNFAITEGFLFLVVMAFLFVKNANNEASVVWPLAVGGVFAVVAPLVFYPWSRTIWSAIDLAMTPLELDEIIAAQDATEVTAMETNGDDPGGDT
jgi:uncharacterized protein (DUF983 family)